MAKRKKRSRSGKATPPSRAPVPPRPAVSPRAPAPPRPEGPPAGGPAATSRRQKLLLIAFGLAVLVVLLLVLEGALTLLGLGDRYRYEDPFVGFEPGADLFQLEDGPDGAVYRTSPNKLAFFNAQEFPAEKPEGTTRIFALGGSTTAGRPYDDRVAFAHWLELYLAEMETSRRFEVINAGAISYASYRIVVLMQELVRYEPDLFVIYTGHNEFLEERTYSDVIHEDPGRRRLRLWLGRLRGVTLAREGLRRLRPPRELPGTLLASEVEARLAGWTGLDAYRRDDELRRSVVEHFELSLRRMVSIARDHGSDVIFVRPVSNLKDFSPFKSEPGPDGAEAAFRRGQDHFARGEYDAAKRAFVGAKDLDVAPLRALEPIIERLDAVATESNVPRIDLPAILEDDCETRYGHRILGNEYLLDHVHPDISVHSLIAERVIDVLVERGVARPQASWSEARRRAVYDRLVDSIDRRYYAERDRNLGKVLGWSGKLAEAEAPLLRAAEVLEDDPDVFLNLGILYQKTGRPAEAVRELKRAAELDPSSPQVRFNLGVSYGLLGRLEEGIDALGSALRLREDYPEAHYNLGVLLRRRGDFEGAVEALGKVVAGKPEAAQAHREIGLVYRRQNRLDEAVAAFQHALEIDPADVMARTDLAITYARQGREEAALEELEQAADRDPSYAEAHYNLGVVQARLGRTDEAIAAYRRALETADELVDAYNNLGILLAGRGELGEARRLLERAVELDPGHGQAHLNLGVVYDQSGQRDLAISAVQRALEIDPENPRIRQALGLLLGNP